MTNDPSPGRMELERKAPDPGNGTLEREDVLKTGRWLDEWRDDGSDCRSGEVEKWGRD